MWRTEGKASRPEDHMLSPEDCVDYLSSISAGVAQVFDDCAPCDPVIDDNTFTNVKTQVSASVDAQKSLIKSKTKSDLDTNFNDIHTSSSNPLQTLPCNSKDNSVTLSDEDGETVNVSVDHSLDVKQRLKERLKKIIKCKCNSTFFSDLDYRHHINFNLCKGVAMDGKGRIEKQKKCEYCNKQMRSSNLSRHMRSVHGHNTQEPWAQTSTETETLTDRRTRRNSVETETSAHKRTRSNSGRNKNPVKYYDDFNEDDDGEDINVNEDEHVVNGDDNGVGKDVSMDKPESQKKNNNKIDNDIDVMKDAYKESENDVKDEPVEDGNDRDHEEIKAVRNDEAVISKHDADTDCEDEHVVDGNDMDHNIVNVNNDEGDTSERDEDTDCYLGNGKFVGGDKRKDTSENDTADKDPQENYARNKTDTETTCFHCDKTFSRPSGLKRHLKTAHDGKNAEKTVNVKASKQLDKDTIKCKFCNTTFKVNSYNGMYNYKYHNRTVHSKAVEIDGDGNHIFTDIADKKPTCPHCKKTFSREQDVKRHVQQFHQGKAISKEVNTTTSNEQAQLSSPHGKKLIPVIAKLDMTTIKSLNDSGTSSSKTLKQTFLGKSKGNHLTLSQKDSEKVNDNLVKSADKENSKKRLQCKFCDSSFDDARGYKRHNESVHCKAVEIDDDGNYTFTDAERPTCSYCNKTYRSDTLERHIWRVHSQELDEQNMIEAEISGERRRRSVTLKKPVKYNFSDDEIDDAIGEDASDDNDEDYDIKKETNDGDVDSEEEATCGKRDVRGENIVRTQKNKVENDHAQAICFHCNKFYVMPYSLKKHLRKEHGGKNAENTLGKEAILEMIRKEKLKCRFCVRIFELKYFADYKYHNKIMHEKNVEIDDEGNHLFTDVVEKHECSHCDTIFSSKYTLKLHMESQTVQKDLKAVNGDNSTENIVDSEEEATRGKRDVETDAQAICFHCNKFYILPYSLKKHLRKEHGGRNAENTLGKDAILEMIRKEKLKCRFCIRIFELKDFSDYKYHNKTIHKKNVEIDDDGNQMFTDVVDVEKHECSHCDTIFSSKYTLKLHLESQTVQKDLKAVNGDNSTENIVLDDSEKKTSIVVQEIKDENKIKCRFCKVTFQAMSHYKYHNKTVHLKKVDIDDDGNHTFTDVEHKPTCSHCNKTFSTKNAVQRHIKSWHEAISDSDEEDIQPYCTLCGTTFRNYKSLQNHKRKSQIHKQNLLLKTANDGVTRLKCPICSRIYNRHELLREHIRKFHRKFYLRSKEEERYGTAPKCEVCEKKFDKYYKLRRHSFTAHGKSFDMKCLQCDKAFTSIPKLKKHSKYHQRKIFSQLKTCSAHVTHHASTVHQGAAFRVCRVCKITLSKHSFKNHTKRHAKDSRLKCGVCNVLFSNHLVLMKHKESSHEDKDNPLTCNVCFKKFKKDNELKVHMYIHNDNFTAILCKLCNKKFWSRSSLDKHMKNHEDCKDKILCSQCGKAFLNPEHLGIHMIQKHQDEKPFICDVCGKGFKQRPTLNRHVKIHSGEKKYECPICNQKFSQQASVKRHMVVHSGEKPYKCDFCDKRYSQTSYLNIHVTNHHSGNGAGSQLADSGKETNRNSDEESIGETKTASVMIVEKDETINMVNDENSRESNTTTDSSDVESDTTIENDPQWHKSFLSFITEEGEANETSNGDRSTGSKKRTRNDEGEQSNKKAKLL